MAEVDSVKWWYLNSDNILLHTYVRYLHKTGTIVVITLHPIKLTQFQLSSAITSWVILFVYAIYNQADLHCWEYMSASQ